MFKREIKSSQLESGSDHSEGRTFSEFTSEEKDK